MSQKIRCQCPCHHREDMVHCFPCCDDGWSDPENPTHWAYEVTGPPAVMPKRGPYSSWPSMDSHVNIDPVPFQYTDKPGLKGTAFTLPVDRDYYPPFTPTTDTLEEIGRIIKDRAGYLLAEYEFQKFIADR